MASTNTEQGFHHELWDVRRRLEHIYNTLSEFSLPPTRHPVLDSSLDLTGEDKDQWTEQEHISGLRKLRDTVKVDLDVLQKFLDNPESEHLPPLSTNAPYLLAVWSEFCSEFSQAPQSVQAIFKSFPVSTPTAQGKKHSKDTVRTSLSKVDIVCDNGKRWIRVNTTKNTRLLSEFREIDSYLTDSSEDECEEKREKLEQDFDNSLLRSARALCSAAEANLAEVWDDESEESITMTPKITLRLTRLNPNPEDDSLNDPRIAQTIKYIQDMGISVVLGSNPIENIIIPSYPSAPDTLIISLRINLDLSLLIALVSDLTHSVLPLSVEAANARFQTPQVDRHWKPSKKSRAGSEDEAEDEDLAKHTRALKNQLLQEMGRSMLQEIRDRLEVAAGLGGALIAAQFWTTPEAKERCIRIVEKIGGPHEKRRAHALFSDNGSNDYWENSRFPINFLPLLPIRIFPSNIPPDDILQEPDFHPDPNTRREPFFDTLERTSRDLLQVEIPAKPDRLNASRAIPMKANARLTAHTVRSLLWGAKLGWTTLTANRTSVRAMLKEMKGRRRYEDRASTQGEGEGRSDMRALIHLVDPRSLAEGMRSDMDGSTGAVARTVDVAE